MNFVHSTREVLSVSVPVPNSRAQRYIPENFFVKRYLKWYLKFHMTFYRRICKIGTKWLAFM
jgi:hypothetical protein